jgi:molybdopterin-guanine dinucleotide biosynthesis protein A
MLEPLCAAYGPGCAAPIAAALDQGDLRAVGFHPRIRLSILSSAEVSRFGDPARLFFNVNTAADLQQADALWQIPGSSP